MNVYLLCRGRSFLPAQVESCQRHLGVTPIIVNLHGAERDAIRRAIDEADDGPCLFLFRDTVVMAPYTPRNAVCRLGGSHFAPTVFSWVRKSDFHFDALPGAPFDGEFEVLLQDEIPGCPCPEARFRQIGPYFWSYRIQHGGRTRDECWNAMMQAAGLPGLQFEEAVVSQPEVRANDIPPAGPGTELKKLLKSFGITASSGCQCNKRAATMDEWGPDECERQIDTISGWLKEEARARKLPYVEMLGRHLIRSAIRNARRNHRQG